LDAQSSAQQAETDVSEDGNESATKVTPDKTESPEVPVTVEKDGEAHNKIVGAPLDGPIKFATAPDSKITESLAALAELLETATDMLREKKVSLDVGDRSKHGSEWIAPAIANGDRLMASLREKLELGTFPTKRDRDAITQLNLECIEHAKIVTDKLLPLMLGVPMDEKGQIDIDVLRAELVGVSDAAKKGVASFEGLQITLKPQAARNTEIRGRMDLLEAGVLKLKEDLRVLNELIEGPLDPLASMQAMLLIRRMQIVAEETRPQAEEMVEIQMEILRSMRKADR